MLQISDTHLFEDENKRLLGLKTEECFQSLLQYVREQNARPDVLLVTGDISQDGSIASYGRFKKHIQALGIPFLCCPGNHDNPSIMKDFFVRTHQMGPWHLIQLDSTIPKSNAGRFSSAELAFLEKKLRSISSGYVLLSFHHNPVRMNSTWIDKMVIDNAADFLSCIKKYSVVQGVVFGHVHQEYDATIDGIRFLAAPSTCVQFKPKSPAFTVDPTPPGFRWIELQNDGTMNTRVVRLPNLPPGLEMDSKGY